MHFIRQPFQGGVDRAFYFPGGTRQEIVDEMIHAVAQGVPFITMTGDEGSGKTMICRVLEENLPADLLPLFLSPALEFSADILRGGSEESRSAEIETDDDGDTEIILDDLVVPRTLESFDDMIGIIFEQVVGREVDDAEGTDTESILADIVNSLRAKGKRLLIVFDEAEKIYLAPLERLRRMLDQVNGEAVIVQLLFSGRPLLTENFEQLSIVTFKEVDERHFVLQPLDSETTLAYLNHCMTIGIGEEKEYFSREVVDRIFSVARGNFTKLNRLAREYLEAEKLDTTFLTHLDTSKDRDIEIEPAENRPRRSRVSSGMPNVDLDFLKLPSFKPRWLFYGGGTCAILLLLVIFLGRSGDEIELVQERPAVPVLELKNVEPLDTTAVTVPRDRPGDGVSKTSVTVEKITVVPPADVPPAVPDRTNPTQTAPKKVDTATVTPAKRVEKATERPAKPSEKAAEMPAKPVETVTEMPAKPVEKATEMPAKPVEIVTEKPAKPVEKAAEIPAKPVETVTETPAKPVEKAAEIPAKPVETVTVMPAKPFEKATEMPPKPVETAAVTKKEEVALAPVVESTAIQPPVADPIVEEAVRFPIPSPPEISREPEKKRVREEEKPAPEEVAEAEKKTVSPAAQQNETGLSAAKAKIVVKPLREKIELQQPGEVTILESQNKKIPVAAEMVDITVPASPAVKEIAADAIYRERLAAGARWLIGNHAETYTVQLMVLASDQAEEHLIQMLDSEEYRSVADKLYILRRLGTPPTVKLFYGEYETLAVARKARNTLPLFLRDKQPFAVAITDAVEGSRTSP